MYKIRFLVSFQILINVWGYCSGSLQECETSCQSLEPNAGIKCFGPCQNATSKWYSSWCWTSANEKNGGQNVLYAKKKRLMEKIAQFPLRQTKTPRISMDVQIQELQAVYGVPQSWRMTVLMILGIGVKVPLLRERWIQWRWRWVLRCFNTATTNFDFRMNIVVPFKK